MKYIVIKCGGSIFDKLPDSFYNCISDIHKQGEWKPIVVHGGGALITDLLAMTGVSTTFVNGLRVTTEEVLDVVEMALSGSVNKQIVRKLSEKAEAYGVSGLDGHLFQAVPVDNAEEVGLVGRITAVNREVIDHIVEQGFIPVISPLSGGDGGARYNVNADMAASALAQELGAELCFISDIPGIYQEVNGEKITLSEVTDKELNEMIEKGSIKDGMIPKVNAALEALHHGVPQVSIVNGLEHYSVMQLLQGQTHGTKIRLNEEAHHVK